MQRTDPFYAEPLHKAFYHPTSPKRLHAQQKRTALSPDRVRQALHDMVQQKDKGDPFVRGCHHFTSAPVSVPTSGAAAEVDGGFDESWPASEQPSSVGLADVGRLSPIGDRIRLSGGEEWKGYGVSSEAELADVRGKLHYDDTDRVMGASSQEKMSSDGSTLAKYIERFRMAEPLSREERQRRKDRDKADFWWLANKTAVTPPTPTSSSTPKDESSGSVGKTRSRIAKPEKLLSHKVSARNEEGVQLGAIPLSTTALDQHTQALQKQAEVLLHKSESSFNSSDPIVSTVGLGSDLSSFSKEHHKNTEPQYSPTFVQNPWSATTKAERRPPRKVTQQDDILDQWRRRRRHEQRSHEVSTRSRPPPLMSERPEEDSRLAEFRHRMAGGVRETLSEAEPTDPPAPHLTPLDDSRHHHPQQQSQQDELSNPSRTHHTHQIASPHMLPQTGPPPQVPAHLHLSCDIIPCPEDAAPHQATNSNTAQSSHSVAGHKTTQPPFTATRCDTIPAPPIHTPSPFHSHEGRQHSAPYNGDDSNPEYLTGETHLENRDLTPPELEASTTCSSGKTSISCEDDYGVSEKEVLSQPQTVEVDKLPSQIKTKRRKDESKSNIHRNGRKEKAVRAETRLKPKICDKKSAGSQHDVAAEAGRKSINHTSSSGEGEIGVEEEEKTNRQVSDDIKQKIPPCRGSNRTPIRSAIGKAVNRLFLSSESMAVTSRDSWDSIHLMEQQGSSRPPVSVISEEEGEVDLSRFNVDDFLSDSDEFTDDAILQDLRSKRDIYIQKLRDIEAQMNLN